MVNPVYRHALGCICVGALLVVAALLLGIVLAARGSLSIERHKEALAVPLLGSVGGIFMLIGCCTCCTIQNQVRKNWEECRRQQASHHVQLGRVDDPASQAQPIINGFDPRRMDWQVGYETSRLNTAWDPD